MELELYLSNPEKSIVALLDEIFPHIEEDGKINIHINQVYISGYSSEDYVRQSFLFYTLCKVYFFFPYLINNDLLDKVFAYIKNIYITQPALSDVEKKYIELYLVRGLLFKKSNYDFFLEKLNGNNSHLLYTTPILISLFLATEADALKFFNKSIISKHYLNIAKEAVFFSLKSNQADINKAFHYMDVLYYADILDLDFKEQALELIVKKTQEESLSGNLGYTSAIAKVFEGYCSLRPLHVQEIESNLNSCLKRKILPNSFLRSTFKYSEKSIAEIQGTAYVCLDTYAHLILGFINIFSKGNKIL